MSRAIGVFGGTFDPVHNGHIEVVDSTCELLQLDRVHVLPSARPPHRTKPAATAEQRVEMLSLAFRQRPNVTVDTAELRRRGPSYTVWTLRDLRHQHPGCGLLMLVGADAMAALSKWFHGWELLTLAHFVVLGRPGYSVTVPKALRPCVTATTETLKQARHGAIYIHRDPDVDVSSTDLRAGLGGAGRADVLASPALHPEVAAYIDQYDLYL